MAMTDIDEEQLKAVALLNLHASDHPAVLIAGAKHRFNILSKWDIPKGIRIVEIGCGQGDSTIILAHLVGPEGHITAIDPGPKDYGTPFTLGQAQAHLSTGPLGSRITWVQADPIEYLESHPEDQYDLAVFLHCVWYFPSLNTLERTIRALLPHTKSIAIAEYALSASSANAVPHVLAAFAQATLQAFIPGTGNIRTILSPAKIKEVAKACGMSLVKEDLILPSPDYPDGRWETSVVISEDFLDDLGQNFGAGISVLAAMRDSVISGRDEIIRKGDKVNSMDVWTGMFGVF